MLTRTTACVQPNELGFLLSITGQGDHFSAHAFKDFYLDRTIRFV